MENEFYPEWFEGLNSAGGLKLDDAKELLKRVQVNQKIRTAEVTARLLGRPVTIGDLVGDDIATDVEVIHQSLLEWRNRGQQNKR